jgi:hypothetical protein
MADLPILIGYSINSIILNYLMQLWWKETERSIAQLVIFVPLQINSQISSYFIGIIIKVLVGVHGTEWLEKKVSSSESIIENDEYSTQLLAEAAKLMVEVFDELMAYATCHGPHHQTDGSSNTGQILAPAHRLEEICYRNNLVISIGSAIQLIPRPHQIFSESLRVVAIDICNELRNKKIFPTTHGALVDSSRLIIIDHLPIELRELVPEEIVYQLIGKSFLDPEIPVDDDLVDVFGIEELSTDTILKCLRAFDRILSNQSSIFSLENNTFDHKKRCNIVHDLLSALRQISDFEQYAFNYSGRIDAMMDAEMIAPSLTVEQIMTLEELRIWPTGNNSFVSLSEIKSMQLYVDVLDNEESKTAPNLDPQLHELMRIVLDLVCNQNMVNICDEKFSRDLFDFLAFHFQPHDEIGGLIELNPESVLENIVLPILQNKNMKPESVKNVTYMLSFAIGSNLLRNKRFPPTGLWLPISISKTEGKRKTKHHTDKNDIEFVSPDSEVKIFFSAALVDEDNMKVDEGGATELHAGIERKFLNPDVFTILTEYFSNAQLLNDFTAFAGDYEHVDYLEEFFAILRGLGIIIQ